MINAINILNYRNIAQFSSDLQHLNILIAPNGSGKTNFLESIYYTFMGTSFKSIESSADVIGPIESFSKVAIAGEVGSFEAITTQSENSLTRQFKKNNKREQLSKIQNECMLVIFAPHSVDLVDGAPEVRRADFDLFLSSIDYQYKQTLKRYVKVLKNKNALLKNLRDFSGNREQLTYWNTELSKLAYILVSKRILIVNEIAQNIPNIAHSIFNSKETMSVTYQQFRDIAPEHYADQLLQMYTNNIEKEIIVGKTLYGPHKDTIEVNVDEKPLRFFGSRGEQRLGTFALKLAQLKKIQEFDKPIILLVDDIFSELDTKHRENVSNIIMQLSSQTILTSADENEVPKNLQAQAKRISL